MRTHLRDQLDGELVHARVGEVGEDGEGGGHGERHGQRPPQSRRQAARGQHSLAVGQVQFKCLLLPAYGLYVGEGD